MEIPQQCVAALKCLYKLTVKVMVVPKNVVPNAIVINEGKP